MAKKRLLLRDKNGNPINYDVGAGSITLDGENGKDLPTKLAEMETQIGEAGSGDGTVTGVKVGSNTYEPTEGVVDLSTPFSGKVDKVDGKGLSKNDYTDADKAKVDNLKTVATSGSYNDLTDKPAIPEGATPDQSLDPNSDNAVSNAAVCDGLSTKANDNAVVKSISVNGQAQSKDTNGNVNIQVQAGGESIVFDTEGTPIIDSPLSPNADTVLGAASARWVKEIDNNVKAILAALAGIAFTGTKPTWQTVAKRKYNLTMTALTGCTGEVVSGDAGNGQVYEGGVRIKLTPTQASYAFTSVTVNGESAATTATGDTDGSVYLDIVVNGNITVAATAISGRAVNFNGGDGATIGAAGVAIGQDLDTTITANEHYTLPQSITVKIGNSNVTHTYTRAQDNKTATLHIDAANITGDLTITCTADEDAHVTIAISGSNFVVKQGSTQLSNGSKVYNGSAAQTLTIEPASGCKFSTLPSADKGTMTNNGPYEASSLEIGTSVSGTLTITAAGAALDTFSIDLSGLVGVTSSNLAESILEGSPYSTTLSKTDASAAGSVIIGTCTMGNEDITPPSGSTISVAHVTGHIVIAASVGVQPSIIHSYDMAIDTDANNKRYIADTGDMGSFPLYNSADVGFDTETFGSGWYGNGSYTPNRNGGFVKYGNPALGLSAGDDFSVVLRDLFVYPKAQNINPPMTIGYNDGQVRIKFYPEREVNRNLDSEVGQFELSVWRNATSGAIGNGDYVQLNIKKWTLNTSYFGSSGKFPCTREKIAGTDTYTHTYHLMMTFVASTLKATAYLIDIDNVNNTVTVTNGGSLTMEANLKITGLGFKKMSELGGLDIYNYAVAENNIAGLFTNNN